MMRRLHRVLRSESGLATSRRAPAFYAVPPFRSLGAADIIVAAGTMLIEEIKERERKYCDQAFETSSAG